MQDADIARVANQFGFLSRNSYAALREGKMHGTQRVFSVDPFPNAPSNVTLANQWPAQGEFYAFRLILGNQTNEALTLTWAKGAVSYTDAENGATLTHVPVTFGGATAQAQAAATGLAPQEIPSLVVSDTIYVNTLPNQAAYFLHARGHYAGKATAGQPGATDYQAIRTLTGFKHKSGFAVGSIGDTTGITMTEGQIAWPWAVQFFYKAPTVTVAVVGGSTSKGQGSSGNANSAIFQACRAKTTAQRIYSPLVAARSGANSATALAMTQEILTKLKPDVLFILTGSGNDALLDNAAFCAMKVRVGLQVAMARENGARPVLMTLAPANLSGISETLRLEHNDWVRAQAGSIDIVDQATVLENPLNRAQLRAEYNSGDNVHWNDAGYTAVYPLYAAVL